MAAEAGTFITAHGELRRGRLATHIFPMRVHDSRSFARHLKRVAILRIRSCALSFYLAACRHRKTATHFCATCFKADHIAKSEIHIIVRIETIKHANLKTLFRNHG
jgi:hypothetical protein